MTDREQLSKLIKQAKLKLWGKRLSDIKSEEDFIADYLIEHNVIRLPCKVGDMLCIESAIKGHFSYFEAPDLAWIVENKELFGKEIFFNREEAEKALKGSETK